jgi:hypothetical protein
MKVSELKKLVDDLPDDMEVVLDGNHDLVLEAECQVGFCGPFNQYGQTHFIENPYDLLKENRVNYKVKALRFFSSRY